MRGQAAAGPEPDVPSEQAPDGSEPAVRPRPGPGLGGEGPSFLAMIGFVAVVVALVIVIFFTIGYVLGRLFL